MRPNSNDNIFDYAMLANYVDFMHFNRVSKADEVIKLGVPPTKIIIEIVSLTSIERSHSVTWFDLNSFKRFLQYDEICDLLINNKVTKKVYDNDSERMTVEYIDASGRHKSLAFENTRTVANKTRLAVKRNFAGMAMFTVDSDDSYGRCPIEGDTFDDFNTNPNNKLNITIRYHRTYPLLRTISQAILLTHNEMIQQITTPQYPHKHSNHIQNQTNASTWDIFLGNLLDSFQN